jgi:hypothetical protein
VRLTAPICSDEYDKRNLQHDFQASQNDSRGYFAMKASIGMLMLRNFFLGGNRYKTTSLQPFLAKSNHAINLTPAQEICALFK